MTIDYTIKAIPTVYRGRRYRSRLEAKWAAFFDLIHWQFEYEPYDLGIWSPDFLLTGVWPSGHVNHVMVEVKPIAEFDHETAEKMRRAQKSLSDADDRRFHDLLLLGTSPMVEPANSVPRLGWIIEDEWDNDGNSIGLVEEEARFKIFANNEGVVIDFASIMYGIGGVLTGFDSMFAMGMPQSFRADLLEIPHSVRQHSKWLMEQWAEAGNLVQWKPPV